ncbi:uncharacterized protein LOC133710962 [Rosa rugosa]|uniref:uncharacterized protein LOC133710962 n=1 Tax=Rosa rugosa TaxID=74645 RepID=UPI002B40C741|nr:uncharacterized protein LOC133710962 [Rosa rugosa]XP_061993099.1 uncharacterized protein LOC133710962 [Rosa rugosa]
MESISGGRVSSSTINNTPSTADQKVAVVDPISPDFRKAISSVLSRWNGLEMAVQNQWGGRDSTHKAQQLSADILSWFSQSKAAPRYVEDLENLLHERMILSFNTDIEDGSIEEVAEQLMIVHEEYLHGNH